MSAPTFKVGDRVRNGRTVGVIDKTNGTWVRIAGTDDFGKWTRWADSLHCVACPPMSPQARMLWHAMRAGVKRTNGRVFVLGQRKRTYWNDDGVILTIYGDYRAEVQS